MIKQGMLKTNLCLLLVVLFVINMIQVNMTIANTNTIVNTNKSNNLDSLSLDFNNGTTVLIEANQSYTLNLMNNIQIDLFFASKSINVTFFDYEINPLTEAGLNEYTLHSNFIAFNSSLPAWDSIIMANISKTLSEQETKNLVIGIEKVFFLSYDLGAQTYEAPDGKDRLSSGNVAKTRINNLDRVFVLAEITEGEPNSSPGFSFFLVPLTIIGVLIFKKKK